MKKCKIIFVVLSLVIMFAMICGCYKYINPTVEGLTAEQISEIRKEYIKIYGSINDYDESKLNITGYYGTYNGHIVFTKKDNNYGYGQAVNQIYVDGVFICSNPEMEYIVCVYLYSENLYEHDRVLMLNKAYEYGYITKDNLLDIADLFKDRRA